MPAEIHTQLGNLIKHAAQIGKECAANGEANARSDERAISDAASAPSSKDATSQESPAASALSLKIAWLSRHFTHSLHGGCNPFSQL